MRCTGESTLLMTNFTDGSIAAIEEYSMTQFRDVPRTKMSCEPADLEVPEVCAAVSLSFGAGLELCPTFGRRDDLS